jgi:multiple antibiotic resistance protein
MLFEKRNERREKQTATARDDPSVFPLATPLIAGPGALATIILLSSRHSGDLPALLTIHLVLLALLGLTYLVFLSGGMIERALGQTGVVVVTRLLGILLAALAIQFVIDGLHDAGIVGG